MLGFDEDDLKALESIFKVTKNQFVYTSDEVQHGVEDYWPTAKDVYPALFENARLKGDCDTFAIACMHRAMTANYDVRLVVCYDELKEGHCICEVASKDKSQAYYFDNRRSNIVALNDEHGYQFLGVSPWNPQAGEVRPWNLVENQPIIP